MMNEGLVHEDLFYAVSNREDGNLSCEWGQEREVVANRVKFLEENGWMLEGCVKAHLTQGDVVVAVGENDLGRGMSSCEEEGIVADSLITSRPGVYLFLLTADCMPTVLYDPIRRALALVHLGRPTTSLRLIEKTVTKMTEEWGTNPEDLLVHCGPSIRKDSYKLDSFNEDENEWQDFFGKGEDGRFWVDVLGHNQKQLLDMGVKEDNIYTSSIDTFTSPKYFSHYRSVRTGEAEGRFATVVGMK